MMELSDVSSQTGIGVETLAAVEDGRATPTGDQLLILAELFHIDYKFFLSNEKKFVFEQTEILYRMYGEHLGAEDRWAIQEMLFFCENEAYLQEALGRTMRRLTLPKPKGEYAKGQGWDAARQVRAELGLGDKGIAVDLFRLFRSLGIHIFRRPLKNSNVSGLCINHPTAGPCVFVNYGDDQYRQRFTVCHEVAHALLDVSEDGSTISLESERGDLREVRANSFAGAFLLPPSAIEGISLRGMSVDSFIELCSRMMVNARTLLIALKDRKLATELDMERFWDVRVPRSGKPDPELGPDLTEMSRERRQKLLERGLPYPYLRLCFEGYQSHKVSFDRLSEVLLMDLTETAQVMHSFGEAVSLDD
jgi:Zn-dependent peptidase ImmA (M78 family)